jgi:hypothetical protein
LTLVLRKPKESTTDIATGGAQRPARLNMRTRLQRGDAGGCDAKTAINPAEFFASLRLLKSR